MIGNEETNISLSCSDVTALSGTNAIRIFHARALCDDGGMRMDGIPILSAKYDGSDMGVRHTCYALSTNVQDCIRADGMEHCGCNRSHLLYCPVFL